MDKNPETLSAKTVGTALRHVFFVRFQKETELYDPQFRNKRIRPKKRPTSIILVSFLR